MTEAYVEALQTRRAAMAEAAYAAEEEYLEGWIADRGDGGDDDALTPAEVEPYVDRVLAREGVTDRPEVRLVEHGTFGGWVRDEVVHLDPRCLTRRVVLHELAHWQRPEEAHGLAWADAYAALLRAEYGPEVGAMMRDQLVPAIEEALAANWLRDLR